MSQLSSAKTKVITIRKYCQTNEWSLKEWPRLSLAKMSSVPTLGSFKVRYSGQSIRLLLSYVGVQYQDKYYEFGPGNSMEEVKSITKHWLADKFNLGLDFPNLPYYIDGDLKISQNLAILRYLGRKHGLTVTDEEKLVAQDIVEQEIEYLRFQFTMQMVFLWTDDKQKLYKAVDDLVVPHLHQLSNFFSNKQWLFNQLTYVDFFAYEILDWIRLFNPQTFAKFPVLTQYMTRFESLEPIKKYMSSEKFISWPVFSPVVKWTMRTVDSGVQTTSDREH